MNALTLILVSLLALASGKPFFPVVQYAGFPTPFNPYVSYPFPSNINQNTVYPVPVLKDATGSPYSPAISPVATGVQGFVSPFTRYHAQEDDGSYSFAYSEGPSSRTESRDQFGNVQGAFNYIDPEGKVQTQQYVADSAGFRVAATNLPVAPVVNLQSPKPVEETPEVKAARAAFEAKYRTKRDAEADPAFITATAFETPASTVPLAVLPKATPVVYSAGSPTPFPSNFFYPYQFPGAFPQPYSAAVPTPVTYSAPQNTFPFSFHATPAAFPFHQFPQPLVYTTNPNPKFAFKPGTLTKTVHGPRNGKGASNGVSYRVDA